MKYRILLIDDEAPALRKMEQFLVGNPDIDSVQLATSAIEALEMITNFAPHIIFLDIHMPEMTGLEFLEQWPGDIDRPAIIFCTAYDQYAIRAFELKAVDYLLKPFSKERFEEALHRIIQNPRTNTNWEVIHGMLQQLQPSENGLKRLWINHRGKYFPIAVDSILYFKQEGNYAELFTQTGKKYLLRKTLKDLIEQLDTKQFVQSHKSHLVNLNQIVEIVPKSHGDAWIVLDNNERVPLSRNYRQNVLG